MSEVISLKSFQTSIKRFGMVISIFIFTAESSISGNLSETSFPPLSSFLHYLEKMGKLGFVNYIIKYHIILYTFFCLYWYTFF